MDQRQRDKPYCLIARGAGKITPYISGAFQRLYLDVLGIEKP